MKKAILLTAVPLLVVSVAWGASLLANQSSLADCLTQEDVVRHHNESRSGISLTCNETIRLRNQNGGDHE
ncbi:MAG: hypothetical protein ACRBC3_19100 [Burkholderiaceae bacterium]